MVAGSSSATIIAMCSPGLVWLVRQRRMAALAPFSIFADVANATAIAVVLYLDVRQMGLPPCFADLADVAVAGIGGFLHGLYWYFPVPSADKGLLPIPVQHR